MPQQRRRRSSRMWDGEIEKYEDAALVDQAKEELEILESLHPNRFRYLKLDLQALISDFQSRNATISIPLASPSAADAAAAAESSCGSCSREKRKKRRTDRVLKRARLCLHKIQMFKSSYCSTSSILLERSPGTNI